jgi:hypothetical protein
LAKYNVWFTQFPAAKLRAIVPVMTYVATVPFEVDKPLSSSDPDVRSVSRLPGFVRLEPVSGHQGRYTLTFEVEGGSLRDSMDAADELLVEYENVLNAYHPKRLTAVATSAK